MYKLGFIVLGLVSMVLAAPVEQSPPIETIARSQDGPNPDGSYSWHYETENGIKAQESGALEPSGNEEGDAIAAAGSFSYYDEEGHLIEVTYKADKNGYQPQGAHLPTPPPLPPAIVKALEYIAAHPEENDAGSVRQ